MEKFQKNGLEMIRKLIKPLLVMLAMTTYAHAFESTKEQQIIEHVKHSIALAEQKKSNLSGDALEIRGMSGYKVKHFLNNLCSLPNTSYLEIGCWQGSTLVSALYGNESHINHAVAVDNWAEFGGPKVEFLRNIQKFLNPGLVHFFEQDCFSMKLENSFPVPVNIYFYDGDHSALSQEKAFTFFNDIFEDIFIAIVDDWNWERVREGTLSGFAKLNYRICFDQAIYTDREGDPDGWWNGIYIAVIKKSPTFS